MSLIAIILLLFSTANARISVISEETNETVRVIYEKNIRAVSDAIEGYIVISSPLNACEAVDPAPTRRKYHYENTTEEEDDREERDWVLLSIVYDCDVTTKARNAQLGGYKALIIQNIGSNDSQHVPWHILRFPLVKLNHVLVGEYDGDLLRFNFSYPNNRFYVKFEEDKFYQLMCYVLIGIIIVLLSTMFALFWFQICCAIIIVVPHQFRMLLQRWLRPRKRRLTRPMLQLIPIINWSSRDPFLFEACAICQEDFKEDDRLRVLPCLHGFHPVCVDPWLLRRSRRCPCCMQRVRFPNCEKDEDDEEEYPTQQHNREQRIDQQGTCQVQADGAVDPLLVEGQQQSQSPKYESKASTTTESGRSQEKALDWQLRRFLQNFTNNGEMGKVDHPKNEIIPTISERTGTWLETNLDDYSNPISGATLEVNVGTVDNSSYHLSSPYPLTSNTYTVSTTRGRRTSDATTISGSLPRDESFQNGIEIQSEINEVGRKVDSEC